MIYSIGSRSFRKFLRQRTEKNTSIELVQVLGQTRPTAFARKDRQQTNLLAGLPPEGMDKFVRIHTQTASHANGAGFQVGFLL